MLWPGWIALALGGSRDPVMYAVFAAGAFLMRAAGCAINDFWDRDLDARTQRARIRPVASGELSPQKALACAACCALGACALLPMLPAVAAWQAPFFGAAAVLYPLAKRRLAYPQAVLAVTFSGGALMGYAASGGGLGAPGWLLQAACGCWIFGYDTVYAFQDIEDDRKNNAKSSALSLGANAGIAVRLSYAAAAALFLLAGAVNGATSAYYAGVTCFALTCATAVRLEESRKLTAGAAFAVHAFAGAPLFIGALFSLIAP